MQISADELRRKLAKGFENLMEILPEGKEEILAVASGAELDGNELELLSTFASIAGSVRRHYNNERVPTMLVGAKAILAGDEDWFVQRYLD